MSKQSKYTKEKLEPIIQRSNTVSDVLRELNLKQSGGNHHHIVKLINQYGIDRSHFIGQGHNKGKKAHNKRPTAEYLNNEHKINSSNLRQRLLKEGYFNHECQLCGLSKWLNHPIPLELHHIDNNHFNNNLSNLQILCPNCHKHIHSG